MKTKKIDRFYQWVVRIIALLGIVLFIFCIILDVTHRGTISWSWAIGMHECFRGMANWTGLRYGKANQLLEDNMGILISVFSLMFTMRESISNRHEKKIYGIPQSEMSKSLARKSYNRVRCVVYLFPFIILLCINLGLCLTGYLVLVYNFIFLYAEFWLLNRSFNRKNDEEKIVSELLLHARMEGSEKNSISQEYQIQLSDVLRGIDESEGWTKAEKLYDEFMYQLKDVPIEKSFGLSFYFVKIIFCSKKHSDGGILLEQCIQRYIIKLYDMFEDEEAGKEAVILYAMLQCAIDIWNAETMNGFIKWCLDFGNRSDIGALRSTKRRKYIVRAEQCAVVIFMLECWLHYYSLREVYFENNIGLLWDYGKSVFRKKETLMKTCADCCMDYLRYTEWDVRQYLLYLTQDSIKNKGRSRIGLIKLRQEQGDRYV